MTPSCANLPNLYFMEKKEQKNKVGVMGGGEGLRRDFERQPVVPVHSK